MLKRFDMTEIFGNLFPQRMSEKYSIALGGHAFAKVARKNKVAFSNSTIAIVTIYICKKAKRREQSA